VQSVRDADHFHSYFAPLPISRPSASRAQIFRKDFRD